DRGEHDRDRDQHRHRRQEAPRPPQPEAAELDVAAALELAQQQRGDQVAADHEEDVDAEEAARHPAEPGAVAEDGEHRQGPHRVDARQVGKTLVLWPAHTLGSVSVRPTLILERTGVAAWLACIIRPMSTTVARPRAAGPDSGLGGNWRV